MIMLLNKLQSLMLNKKHNTSTKIINKSKMLCYK